MKKLIYILFLITIASFRTEAAENLDETNETLYDSDHTDTPPRPIRFPSPKYPKKLWKNEIEGQVTLEFIVNEKGNVISRKIIDSDHPLFSKSVMKAVRKWKFTPGIKTGVGKVKTRVRIDFPFALN